MSTATTNKPASSLRASDADRDRAVAELSEHFQAGRLSVEELEDRTGRALQARTAGELAGLFTDLPVRPPAVTGTAAAPAPTGSFRPALLSVAPIAVVAAIVLIGLLSSHPGLIAIVPVVVFFAIRRLAGEHAGERRAQPATSSPLWISTSAASRGAVDARRGSRRRASSRTR